MLTKDDVDGIVAKLRKVVSEWDAWKPAPEQMVLYLNRGTKPLGEDVKQAFIEAGEAVRRPDIAPPAWQLTLAVDRVFEEFSRWITDFEVAPEAIPPNGSDELWEAVRALWQLAAQRRPPPPPHATMLRAQGANLITIAQRYGWYTEDGRPDQARVNKELCARVDPANGIDERQYNPDTWVHPRETAIMQEVAKRFEDRSAKLAAETKSSRPAPEQRQPCRQSYEELAELPHMTYRQIALMKRVTEDDVRKELDRLGYVKTADGFRRTNETGRRPRGEAEPGWLAQNDPHDEFGSDIDARIVACYEDGLTKPKSIADLLNGARALAVTPAKVAQVIRRHKESQGKPDEAAVSVV